MDQPVPPESISIASIKPGAQFSSLEALLLILKIFPNSDAPGLIEALNSGKGLGAVTSSETIRVLSVASDEKTTATLSGGFLYRVHYDELLVNQLLEFHPVRELSADRVSHGTIVWAPRGKQVIIMAVTAASRYSLSLQ